MSIDVGVDVGSRKIKIVSANGQLSQTHLFEVSDARLLANAILACVKALEDEAQRTRNEAHERADMGRP